MRKILLAVMLLAAFAPRVFAASIGVEQGISSPATANGGGGAGGAQTLPAHNYATGTDATGKLTSAQPSDADLSITDITTNDLSTSAHGFSPRAPNDTSKFLRGDATWAVPTGTTSGTVNTGTVGNSSYYSGTTAVSPVANEFHAGSGTLAAAIAKCPQVAWQANHAYSLQDAIVDSNGNTQIVTTAGTSGTPDPPTWATTLAATTADGTGTLVWKVLANTAGAPSQNCTVIIDPQQLNAAPNAILLGATTKYSVTLLSMGGGVNCTDTGGAGHSCIVVGNNGHLIGPAGQGNPATQRGFVVVAPSTASIDAEVESYSGYLASVLGLKNQQANFDVENVNVTSNASATINKAVFWESSIDGEGYVSNSYIGDGPAGAISLLVDDKPTGTAVTGLWNNLTFNNVWVAMGADAYAVKVVCSSLGGINFVWTGGAVSDGTTSNAAGMMTFVGTGSNICSGFLLNGLYAESKTGQTGDFLQLTDVTNFVAHAANFNGGPALTNCVSISGTAANLDQVHIDGRSTAGQCTNVVNNAVTGNLLTYTTNGAFKYDWSRAGSQPINQIGGLVNPFGPGGQGLYYSAAGTALPACSATYARYFECVSDATACTSGTTYASGGSTACLLQCSNSGLAWKETGVACQ